MKGEERDLAYLAKLLGGRGLLGPGDDAAVLGAARGRGVRVATMDPVVEGRHFLPSDSPRDLGQKLVGRNFSDLAAMAALPEEVLVSFVFGPGWTYRRRCALYRAVDRQVRRFGGRWVGGDVAGIQGPSVFSLTALGRCPGRPIPRDGLRPGDVLHVTGPLGGAPSTRRHLRVEPRLDLAQKLSQRFPLHAMIDLSDGLALDLPRMLRASSARLGQPCLGAELFEGALPLHPSARRSPLARGAMGALAAALGDGEDFELCLGLSARASKRLEGDGSFSRILRRPIGRVCPEPGLFLLREDGTRIRLREEGYLHELP
ncbi:MAG TPA: thiamine-monophosphate kinase [Planctomycetes bacterium]|nr:thiamine-monophosphate kinase [Planctomycetota bacterium]